MSRALDSAKAAAPPPCCQAGTHSDPDNEPCVLRCLGAATPQAARAAGLAHPADMCQAALRAEPPSHHPQVTRTRTRASAHPAPLSGLTLREAWWVVIDIGDYDGDCGGPRQATQLSRHVCCTDHHLIPVLRLTVQVSHSCPDHTWKPAAQHEHRHIAEHPQGHRQGEAGRGHWRLPHPSPSSKQDQLDLPASRHMAGAPILHQPSWPFPGLTLVCPRLSHIWQPRTRHSTRFLSPVLSRRDGSPPSTAGNALPNAALGAAGCPCHRSTLLATTNDVFWALVQSGTNPFAGFTKIM